MANIRVSWTNPADVADQDSVKIFRATGDQTALSDEAFRTAAGTEIYTETTVATGTDEYIDQSVPTGETYTYGAFSYNTAGFGPGDISDTSITI